MSTISEKPPSATYKSGKEVYGLRLTPLGRLRAPGAGLNVQGVMTALSTLSETTTVLDAEATIPQAFLLLALPYRPDLTLDEVMELLDAPEDLGRMLEAVVAALSAGVPTAEEGKASPPSPGTGRTAAKAKAKPSPK